MQNKHYLALFFWIIGLIAIGAMIGSFTKPELNDWYHSLYRSPLTPPNYVFPIAWTILYAMIGFCGWLIWQMPHFPSLSVMKSLYAVQLLLNWSWTPVFFYYHATGLALCILIMLNFLVGFLIFLSYSKVRWIALLMLPYLCWILFAGYLNFYIWLHNIPGH